MKASEFPGRKKCDARNSTKVVASIIQADGWQGESDDSLVSELIGREHGFRAGCRQDKSWAGGLV